MVELKTAGEVIVTVIGPSVGASVGAGVGSAGCGTGFGSGDDGGAGAGAAVTESAVAARQLFFSEDSLTLLAESAHTSSE